MSFSDNLKQLRRDNALSQEELAEMMGVSRQAVSKWELGEGYPEVEKLLALSDKFSVSLDSLMSGERSGDDFSDTECQKGAGGSRSIVITSPTENVVAVCRRVVSSQRLSKRKNAPQYALYGVGGGTSFWGEPTVFLGWYADRSLLSDEIASIHNAITSGAPSYRLKHSVEVEKKLFGMCVKEALRLE